MEIGNKLAARPSYKWWVLAVVQCSIMLIGVDSTIVNLALPTIAAELKADLSSAQWTIAAFFITTAVALPMAGRMADLLGRKAVFVAGFAIFTFASVGCGLAHNLQLLIAMRILQAVGSAALLANSNVITLSVFPLEQHALAMGINGTVYSVGYALGYTLGGFFIQWFGWRSIFLVNLPIGVLAIGLGALVLVEEKIRKTVPKKVPFDFPGAIFSVIALAGIMISLDQIAEAGGMTPTLLIILIIGIAGLCAFIVAELRSTSPLLDLRLFHLGAFSVGSVTRLMTNWVVAASTFMVPFYTQAALGFTPVQSGMMMLPFSIVLAIAGPVAGRAADKFGPRFITTAGFIAGGIGLIIFGSLEAASGDKSQAIWKVAAGMGFLGLGNGLFISPNNSATLDAVPADKTGAASGFIWCMGFLGSAIGTAYAAASLTDGMKEKGGLAALRHHAETGSDPSVIATFVGAQDHVFHTLLVLSVIGAILCAVRVSRPHAKA